MTPTDLRIIADKLEALGVTEYGWIHSYDDGKSRVYLRHRDFVRVFAGRDATLTRDDSYTHLELLIDGIEFVSAKESDASPQPETITL